MWVDTLLSEKEESYGAIVKMSFRIESIWTELIFAEIVFARCNFLEKQLS